MHRDRITLVVLSLALAVGAAVSCTTSDPVNNTNPTGSGNGGTGSGNAGSGSGNAGSGNAGTGSGNAGSGTAGTGSGNAGTGAGTAGTTGTAGTQGTAGSSAGGTTGGSTAGTTGTAGGTGGNAGGAGTGGAGTGGATLSFATDVYPIIMAKCKDCHTKATNPDGKLAMKDAMTAYTSLVGTTMGVAAMTDMTCMMLDATKKRVVPGDPDHSFMYIKISQTQAALNTAKCGTAMPENNANGGLSAAEKTKIHDWIMQGAKM